jgi:hypothetical protein
MVVVIRIGLRQHGREMAYAMRHVELAQAQRCDIAIREARALPLFD